MSPACAAAAGHHVEVVDSLPGAELGRQVPAVRLDGRADLNLGEQRRRHASLYGHPGWSLRSRRATPPS